MSASDDQDQVSKTRVMYWELELNVALLICDCIFDDFSKFRGTFMIKHEK